jgi:hypothetical protein
MLRHFLTCLQDWPTKLLLSLPNFIRALLRTPLPSLPESSRVWDYQAIFPSANLRATLDHFPAVALTRKISSLMSDRELIMSTVHQGQVTKEVLGQSSLSDDFIKANANSYQARALTLLLTMASFLATALQPLSRVKSHTWHQRPMLTARIAIVGLDQAYSFGADFSGPLAIIAIVLTGDLTSLTWSIGQGYKPALLGELLSDPEGISFSHNSYESDASIVRVRAPNPLRLVLPGLMRNSKMHI